MLVALDPTDLRLMAWEATKRVAYRCPACGEPVTLKRGTKVIDHYAHRPGAACANAGETKQHLEMKAAFYRAIHDEAGCSSCELERPLGGRRADVFVPLVSGRKLALECQHSNISADEATQKLFDYAAHTVDCLYIVHAEAFPDYDRRVGITSLHGREVAVPGWVRAIATPQHHLLEMLRGKPRFEHVDTYPYPDTPIYVHVWANGELWAVSFGAVYRESYWGRYDDVTVLTRIREGKLLGRIEQLDGPWGLLGAGRPAIYDAMADLAALREPHPSVLAALEAAPPLPVVGRKREARGPGETPCRAPTRGAATAAPQARSVANDRSGTGRREPAEQLGLGLDTAAADAARRRVEYD